MIAISLPFRIDGYGRVSSTNDISRVWADRVRTVVSTQPGERVMRPHYGCPMPADLFTAMEAVPEIVESDVTTAFGKWLPSLRFNELSIEYQGDEAGEISLNVSYSIPTVVPEASVNYSIVI